MFGSPFMAFLWSLSLLILSCLLLLESYRKSLLRSLCFGDRLIHGDPQLSGDLTAESLMAVSLVLWAQTGPFLHCRLFIHLRRGNVSVAAGILGAERAQNT